MPGTVGSAAAAFCSRENSHVSTNSPMVTPAPKRSRSATDLSALAHGQEGARSRDGKVSGSYVHGLFVANGFRHAFLNRLAQRQRSGIDWESSVEQTLDALARHLENALDLDRLLEIARVR